MKSKSRWITILVVIVSLCLWGWSYGRNSAKTVWEYKIVRVSNSKERMRLEQILNRLGAEGWELVLYEPEGENWPRQGYYYFKRAK